MPTAPGRIKTYSQAANAQRVAHDFVLNLKDALPAARSVSSRAKLATALSGVLREFRECSALTRSLRPGQHGGPNAPAPGTTPKATRPKPAMREEPTATAAAEVPEKAKESISAGETEKDGGGGETPSE